MHWDLARHSCVDFGTGTPNGYHSFGQVCVDITTASITVTYPTLADGSTYTGAHLYLGSSAPTDSSLGQFPYNKCCTSSGTTGSCTVPLTEIRLGDISCNEKLYIAAQPDVDGSNGGTGWGNAGQGTVFDCRNPKSNCAKYWIFATQ